MLSTFQNPFFRSIRYVLVFHASGLLVLSLLRLALFISGLHFLQLQNEIPGAFIRGLWFDNVIACYISFVPLILLSLAHFIGYGTHTLRKIIRWWMVVLWLLAIAVSMANIPYFLFFFKNINSSIWNWAEYGATTLGMLFGEPAYYPPLLVFFLLMFLLVRLSRLGINKTEDTPNSLWIQRMLSLAFGILLTGFCFLGIRGRLGLNPIRVSAAYYCDDAFLNQLGINPAFNLIRSTLDDKNIEKSRLHLMPNAQALQQAQHILSRKGNAQQPLGYDLKPSQNQDISYKGYNVVLILMESMTRDFMERGLTPFLDSLSQKSVYFPNTYSAGNHTNQGLYATLYSFPAILSRNHMKGSNTPRYNGLPTVLRQAGYRTLFFMTHEAQYDNMEAFFRTNGYEDIYSQQDYPREKVVNTFGVQDDFLYDYALKTLRQLPSTQPFFATLLSISNHVPFVIPNYFHPHAEKKEEQIVEYADWSLAQFFKKAQKEAWYEKTLFVLLADHGKLIGKPDSEMPQSLNHIPLIFLLPKHSPEIRLQWAQQMDVQPTLLSLLGINARQNNFGMDLFSKQRPCAYYSSDNLIAARDSTHQIIYNPKTTQTTLLRHGQPIQETDSTFNALRNYLFTMMQAAEAITQKELTK